MDEPEAVGQVPARREAPVERQPGEEPERPAPRPQQTAALVTDSETETTSDNGSDDDVGSFLEMVRSWTGAPGEEVRPTELSDDWIASVQGEVDLALLAGLANWANTTIRKMGGKRAKAILEVYVMTGLISADVSRLLQLFVSFDGKGSSRKPAMKDVLSSLMLLDKVLGRQVDATAMALSLLLDGES